MNLAQGFMVVQIITCLMGVIGFWWNDQPWSASVWLCYSLANIGWWKIAGGSL